MCLMYSALDGAEEVEHVEHRARLEAVGNEGATVVDITVTFTRTYTRLSVFVQLVNRFLLLIALLRFSLLDYTKGQICRTASIVLRGF
jgi:hypothetical protein